MATYIFPELVMKLVENNLTVNNLTVRVFVVSENGTSLWASRLHMLRVSKAQMVNSEGTSREEVAK
jgi:hypothetical protein